jgi:site-specific DNA recombinase
MTKRAAIYVRVSTELQGQKVSPQEQEKDCRAYCAAHGYEVARLYRDTEKYRVGKRQVEPSGTRSDRPQFRQMLADAEAFDVIVAWKEDRLYRSYRPMLDVLDCLEAHKLSVELVMEHFDPTLAPVKAWAARMELKAKSERTAMGRGARLAANKMHPAYLAFGYRMSGDAVEIYPPEAVWVRRIFDWYVAGVSIGTIRHRLIADGATQRGATSFGKGKLSVPWNKGVIQKILHNDTYSTGRLPVKMASGQHYALTLPAIIAPAIAEQARQVRTANKTHRARNVKHDYLVGGLAYCARCGVKLCAHVRYNKGKAYTYYNCTYHMAGYVQGAESGCCRSITANKLDNDVWAKVWRLLSDDEHFEARVRAKVEVLRTMEMTAEADAAQLESDLDDIQMQRQQVMNWALARKITEDDMDTKLAALGIEEAGKRRELSEKSLLLGNRADKLIAFANKYRAKLRRGGDFLNSTPASAEAAAEQFALRREIVQAVCTRIEVNADKSPTVIFVLNLTDEPAGVSDLNNSTLQEFINPTGGLLNNLRLGPLYLKS